MEATPPERVAADQPAFPEGPAPGPEGALSWGAIDRITGFEAGPLRVVSMYWGVDPGDRKALQSEADSQLHDLRLVSKDEALAHDARVSLRRDIERIEELVADELPNGPSVAIFACSGADLFEVVALPRAVRTRTVVEEKPYVGPLLAVLEEYERLLAVVVQREWAHLWEVYLGRQRDAGRLKGPDLRRFDAAGRRGRSTHHSEDKAEGLERQFFKELAAALEHMSYDALALGGHEYELPHLIELLPRSVSERMIGTFTIDPSAATAADVGDKAQALLDDHERKRQHRLVDEVAESVAAGGSAVLGLDQCLWAASVEAVQMLLVQEGVTVPGVVCDESGWLARSGETCPLCGRQTRATEDVIEELIERVITTSGGVRHIGVDTVLAKHLTGALLRFPLPPGPDQGH